MKLIRDEELLNYIKNHDYELVSRMGCVDRGMFTDGIEHAINVQEAVEVVEVVHGRWIWHDEDKFFTCSNCEYSALNNYRGNSVESNYCPNCGAKMDKEVIWLNN